MLGESEVWGHDAEDEILYCKYDRETDFRMYLKDIGSDLIKVQCAFDFVAKYQFPIPLAYGDMRPGREIP